MLTTDRLLHKWLRLPYRLPVVVRPAKGKSEATVILLHGMGNSTAAWHEVVEALPETVRVVAIDLLGFGRSPQPDWVRYDAKTQARSVMRTIMYLALSRRVIIVGHSMGALVGIELAKRYPRFISALVLCSPPLYRWSHGKKAAALEKVLKEAYALAQKSEKLFVQFLSIATKYKLLNKAFNVTDKNSASYMAALDAAIVNQTSYDDIMQLTLPIRIIRGRFDPVVVPAVVKDVASQKENVTAVTIAAGHEIKGIYTQRVVREVQVVLSSYTK